MELEEALKIVEKKTGKEYSGYMLFDNKYWFCSGDPVFWDTLDENGEVNEIDTNEIIFSDLFKNNEQTYSKEYIDKLIDSIKNHSIKLRAS